MERRNANYKLLAALKGWESVIPSDHLDGTCGNISNEISGNYDFKTYKYNNTIFNGRSLYQVCPAPMLLSRLCAGFKGLKIETGGQGDYKTTWHVVLKHVKTGQVLTFYDYKGAASIGSKIESLDNAEFLSAVKKLMKALVDGRFPHPYDGCVVGEAS